MHKKKYLTMGMIASAISAPEHAARIVVARCFQDLPTAHVMPDGATRAHKGYEVFAVIAEAQRTLKYYSDEMAAKMMAMAIPAREVAA